MHEMSPVRQSLRFIIIFPSDFFLRFTFSVKTERNFKINLKNISLNTEDIAMGSFLCLIWRMWTSKTCTDNLYNYKNLSP